MRRRQILAGASAAVLGAGRAAAQSAAVIAGTVIRGAYVMTMDPELGDLKATDIHVRGTNIIKIGPDIQVPDAEVVDAGGMVVMPGIVDTHWHMWNSLLRGLVGGTPQTGYFPTIQKYGPHYTPLDTYAATRLALAEALHGGVTTVHNWAHNIRSPGHAEASVRAHESVGLRARFGYGSAQGTPPDKLQDLDDMARLRGALLIASRNNRVTLGAALRGPQMSATEVWRREFEAAKKLGLPISVHATGNAEMSEKFKVIETLDKAGMLGPDVQIIHAVHATPQDIETLARTKTHVSVSPNAEAASMGVPPVNAFRKAGVLTTLSIDNTALPAAVDPFGLMRELVNLLRARDGIGSPFGPRQALEMATIDGARALGLDGVTGSLKPGKHADLILINTEELDYAMSGNAPIERLLMAVQPAHIDSVMVDGRFLKRKGRIVAIDAAEIVNIAHDAAEELVKRAG